MQTINLDLSVRSIIPLLHAKQGDVGRKFKAILTDGGAAYAVPAGAVVSVWYSGASGEGNYTDIGADSAVSVSGNEITVELITQMLTNYGAGSVCLVINTADGDQLGTWSIPYMVEPLPGMGSAAAQAYFTAFSQAVANLPYPDNTLSVAGRAADAAATGTALASKAPAGYGFGEPLLVGGRTIFAFEGESIEAYCAKIDEALSAMTDYTGRIVLARCVNSLGNFYASSGNCQAILYRGAGKANASLVTVGAQYDWEIRKINGEWQQPEWANPPLVLGVEYRTTKRYQGKPVYTACFSCGNLPASGTTETIWNPPDGGIAHIFASYVTYGNNQGSVNGLGYKAYSHNFNEIRITNEGGDDWSGFTATALIEYWKE